ncbi:MAG TPA: cation diffusion facilitator family transporter [Acetobacteraceae bacterium]
MPHDHAHHVHTPTTGGAFAIGAGINLAYVLIEAGVGLAIHSTALLADAGHNLGDVIGLVGGWIAVWLSTREPTRRFTYGMRRASVLAALANAVILLLVTGAIAAEAGSQLADPAPTRGLIIMGVALAGIPANGVAAWVLAAGRQHDLNLRAAFAHMIADVGLAVGVAVAGLVIAFTGWYRVDPIVSLVIAAIIIAGTWDLLRQSVSLSLDAVPASIDAEAVAAWLRALPGVDEVHDLHIWALSTTDTALTAHLVRDDAAGDSGLLSCVTAELRERFGIGHATVQLETRETAHLCGLRPEHVV